MNKTFYLYGFMGSGKSYLGRITAAELNLRFVDLDEYIVNRECVQIAEIFGKYGEQHFRKLELTALKEIDTDIISLGGGALTDTDTAAFVRGSGGVVIYIDTPFEVCYERIMNDTSRPLASGKSREELLTLYNSRAGHYKNIADYITKGEDLCSFITQELKR